MKVSFTFLAILAAAVLTNGTAAQAPNSDTDELSLLLEAINQSFNTIGDRRDPNYTAAAENSTLTGMQFPGLPSARNSLEALSSLNPLAILPSISPLAPFDYLQQGGSSPLSSLRETLQLGNLENMGRDALDAARSAAENFTQDALPRSEGSLMSRFGDLASAGEAAASLIPGASILRTAVLGFGPVMNNVMTNARTVGLGQLLQGSRSPV